MNSIYEQAEIDSRRYQLTHDFAVAQRGGATRRGLRRLRRERLDVVAPYGDARA